MEYNRKIYCYMMTIQYNYDKVLIKLMDMPYKFHGGYNENDYRIDYR
jgi:peptide subunit release factor RF-3